MSATTGSTIDRWGEDIDLPSLDQPDVPRRLRQEHALSERDSRVNDAQAACFEADRWGESPPRKSPEEAIHAAPNRDVCDGAVGEAEHAARAGRPSSTTEEKRTTKDAMPMRGLGSPATDDMSDLDIKPTLPRRQETGSVSGTLQGGEDETMPPAGGVCETGTELSSNAQTTETEESTPRAVGGIHVEGGAIITHPVDTESGSPDTPVESDVTPLPPRRQESAAATGSGPPDPPLDSDVKPLPPRRQETVAATGSGSPDLPCDSDAPLPSKRQETAAAAGFGSPDSLVDSDVKPLPPRRQESVSATTRGEEGEHSRPGAFRVGGTDDLEDNSGHNHTVGTNHNSQSDLADIKRQVREEIMGRTTTPEVSCSKAKEKAKTDLIAATVRGPQDTFGTVADADVKPTPPRRQETASTAPDVAQDWAPGAFPSGGDYNLPGNDAGTIVYDVDAGIAAASNHTESSAATRDSAHQILRLPTLEAVPVQEEDAQQQRAELEEEVRQRILQEAIQADVVVPMVALHEDDEEEGLAELSRGAGDKARLGGGESSYNLAQSKRTTKPRILALMMVLGIVALAIGLSFRESGNGGAAESSNSSMSTPQLSLLEQIKKRGYFRCGIYLNQPGFGYRDKKTGIISGANYDFCRAISAAVFSDSEKFEIVATNAGTRFSMLANGEIDVVSQPVTATMERDMAEQYTGQGFAFSHPFYYAGTTFGGVPEFLQCAERLDPFHGHCRGLRICVTIGTTQEAVVNELLPGPVAVRYEEPGDAMKYMNDGTCNVIAAERHHMNTGRLRTYQGLMFNITFELGNSTFSRDPLALVTMDGEPEWSHLVNSVIKILFAAEGLNITRQNAQHYRFEDRVPIALQERIREVVSTVGNYGELFEAAAGEGQEDVVSRTSANSLNQNFDSGLMYSHPFGNLNRLSPDAAAASPTMEHIHARGYLRCGVANLQPGFAWRSTSSGEWSGLHTEVCRGLAAALFQGEASKVDFIDTDKGFQSLQDGMVDVLAGETASLANEFFESSTGSSYSFSTPYFYQKESNSSGQATILALATSRQDELWSSFVYWTITALLYAEERGISASNAIDMPITSLFGFRYAQSLRDCISAIGGYAEIYNRTLGSILPQQGGNLLNENPYGPQQVAFPLY